MQISGVIFDLDGTLGNSLPVSVESIIRTVAAFTGKTYTYDEIVAHFGPTEQGILCQLVPEQDCEASYRRFLQEYESLNRQGDYGVFPGIPEVLDLLRAHQVPTAVVTGKGPDSTRISLRYFGLADAFEIVKTGGLDGPIKDVCIREVAADWGVPLEEIVYVGDGSADVDLSRKAGVKPISVAWAGTEPAADLAAKNPYRLFTQVEDLRVWLARQVGGVSS